MGHHQVYQNQHNENPRGREQIKERLFEERIAKSFQFDEKH